MRFSSSQPRLGAGRRLVISFLAGALATLLVVLNLTVWQRNTAPTKPLPPAPVPPATSSASPSIDPDAGDYRARPRHRRRREAQWEPVLLGFAEELHQHRRPQRGPLAPAARPLRRPRRPRPTRRGRPAPEFPAGRYDSYELLDTGNYQVVAKATYREGWAPVIYLTSDGHGWKVTAYDEWEQ